MEMLFLVVRVALKQQRFLVFLRKHLDFQELCNAV